jgi:RNA polymerase sigma-70 factor (ECF subfamily)
MGTLNLALHGFEMGSALEKTQESKTGSGKETSMNAPMTAAAATNSRDESSAAIQEGGSDEALLIAVGNSQDTAAFNQLFNRFSKKIFALGMKLTRNEQLANDLVQEAMLTVWQKAPLYDLDRGTAQSWIFTLTRNRCFDIMRKMKRQPTTVSADDIWPQEGEGDFNLSHAEQGSMEVEIANIESYYERLSDAQRIVIEQIYIYDQTHEEAAATLDIPLGTLKSRLRLGMGKLRQMIGTEEDE